MNQTLLSEFGNPTERVENAIEALRQGKGILVLDDEDRENEGDLVFAAETMTAEQMAMTIRYSSGIVCLCITEERRKQLDIPMMVEKTPAKTKRVLRSQLKLRKVSQPAFLRQTVSRLSKRRLRIMQCLRILTALVTYSHYVVVKVVY